MKGACKVSGRHELPADPYDRIRIALSAGLCSWPTAPGSATPHGVEFSEKAFRDLQRATRAANGAGQELNDALRRTGNGVEIREVAT